MKSAVRRVEKVATTCSIDENIPWKKAKVQCL